MSRKSRSRTIIVSDGDEALLDALTGAHAFVSHHRAAQLVYRYGLRSMAAAPERLVGEAHREDSAASKEEDAR